jgi:hypothetical protein
MNVTPSIADAAGNRLPAARFLQHPAPLLALLGIVSGTLSTFVPGFAIDGTPSSLGLYMVAAGIWFGLVVAFGVWRFAGRNWLAAPVVVATTWIAWEVAVNLTMQITDYSLKIEALPDTPRYYLGGFAGGTAGALLTWAGAALFSTALRGRAAAASVSAAGALLGLLLPWSMSSDHPAILFVPWQAGVAAMLGHFLGRQPLQGA